MGILQFAKIGEKRGDAERRLNKLKEFTNPNKQTEFLLSNPTNKNQAQAGGKHGKEKQEKGDDSDSDKPIVKKALSLNKDTVKDYTGKNAMALVDYRHTSLHFDKGVNW